jgi:hypothetical protein
MADGEERARSLISKLRETAIKSLKESIDDLNTELVPCFSMGCAGLRTGCVPYGEEKTSALDAKLSILERFFTIRAHLGVVGGMSGDMTFRE